MMSEMRLLTSMMAEEKLVDEAINALQKYKEDKFSNPQPKKENKESGKTGFSGIKDFLSGGSKSEDIEETSEGVHVPHAEIAVLLMKWKDAGKSIQQIMVESTEFEQQLKEFQKGR